MQVSRLCLAASLLAIASACAAQAAEDVGAGQEIYQAQCSACHSRRVRLDSDLPRGAPTSSGHDASGNYPQHQQNDGECACQESTVSLAVNGLDPPPPRERQSDLWSLALRLYVFVDVERQANLHVTSDGVEPQDKGSIGIRGKRIRRDNTSKNDSHAHNNGSD
jgi:cytochrome c5